MAIRYKPPPICTTAFDGERGENRASVRISIKCPSCEQRLFDVTPSATGEIDIKCHRCRHIDQYDLARGIWLHQPEPQA